VEMVDGMPGANRFVMPRMFGVDARRALRH
jgi:hypothetical protein